MSVEKPAYRPLSPHLQIYRWQITMSLSILHRMSGAALAIGTIMLVWWLLAASGDAATYAVFQQFSGSLLGRLMLFGWSVAMFYHLCNGVRHLVWDCGKALTIPEVTRTGILVVIGTVFLTALCWVLVWLV